MNYSEKHAVRRDDAQKVNTKRASDLRAAAKHMREHHGPGHERHAFWTTLATHLEATARDIEIAGLILLGQTRALEIARTYLKSVK